MTARGLVAMAVGAALALAPGAARAVPSVRGATGLIFIPDARLSEGATIFTQDGKVTTGGDKTFSSVEGGVQNHDGRNFYDAKVQVLPDISTDEEWIPGVAIGLRGVSQQNDRREYYFALQKKFTYPECTVVWGMNRAVNWKGSPSRGFYGLELPLFAGFSLVADHENQGGSTNVGARYTLKKTICVYDYILDARGHSDTSKQNIVGACYQKRF